MKKTLLAAALLAGFATAGVAQAETSVTLYGILDTGYGYNQVKFNDHGYDLKSTNSGMQGGIFNGSRFGLRGSEDLGNGTRAIFTLEQGITLGDGTSTSTKQFHRQAWVGLASDDWGTFTMGRQYNMGAVMIYEQFNVGHTMGDMDSAFGAVGYANRMDNSFRYVTPNFSGFQAGVAYANGKTDVTRDDNNVDSAFNTDRTNWVSAGFKYANGPIAFGASYDRQTQNYDDGVSKGHNKPDALTSWNIGASYDFEVVKLALAFGQDRHGKMGFAGAGMANTGAAVYKALGSSGNAYSDFKSNNYYVGLSAPLAGGTAGVTWTHSKSNLDEYDQWTLADGTKGAFPDKAQDIYQINYQYPLSKRTSVYAYGSYGTGMYYLDNAKAKEVGIGLNHKF
ncbi:porin [Castellaniella caeni]|uniref:porin n=1 Tax=Castellaniella caeni TaxID=266123 RepID=UPI000C9FDD41|nr:porin [Castellaniella caeni]